MTLRHLARTDAPAATILIRIVVGAIFVSEGMQKFIDPEALGAGRFAKIGISYPELMGPFVGGAEILCGTCLLLGLATRIACVPVLISMLVAIVTTKGPVLLGHPFAGLALPKMGKYGVWAFLHEARTDMLMLMGVCFLLMAGAGQWSVDARIDPGGARR